MTWTFTLSNATTLRVTSTARNGTTNVVFTTNLTVSAAPDAIQFYATNMTQPASPNSDNRQPYFNNLQISQGDATPPVVTLSANQRLIAIPVGGTYTADAGATATDDVSGNVTSSITNDSSTAVNLAAAGTYTVRYSAKDAANNTGTATQTVVVHPVGTFASQYTNVAAPGLFNGWKADGSGNNALIKTANFRWKLLYYFPNPTNTEYLITANNGYDIKWGVGGARGAGNANLSPTVNTNAWYVFELNEVADTASLSKFTSTTDTDTDGIPDEWEAHYGAQLSPATNNLNPDTIYNESLGGSRTAKQAFEQGLNPIRDGRAPTLNFASGTTAMTLLSLNTNNTGVSGKWEILESDVVATGDSTNETVTVTLETRKLTGTAGLGVDPANIVDTSEASLWKITYAAFDPTGNSTNLVRSIVVGDAAPGWRKLQGPSTNTISTTGSATIYGRIWIDGATPGAGQAPNITAELGVNGANTDPATWAAGAWKAASFNSGFADGDDEYQATINGADLTAGTYFYAYRFKIGNGSWFYAGMNAAGTDGGPWDGTTNLSGTLVVNQAQTRNVTFAVDMRVQQFKNAFAEGEKLVVSGGFNGWGTNNELTLDSGSGLHKATINIEGLEGATNEFKFRVLGTTRTNAGMEYESVSNRALVLGAAGAATNLPTAFFNNLEESRKLTLRVDMTTQIAKGNFNATSNSVYVAGNFNGFSTTANLAAPAPGVGANVYSATLFLDGPQSGNTEYKFFNNAPGAPNSGYEITRENANRILAAADLGANLTETVVSAVPLFSNDDGIGPVITRTGPATINLTVGDSYTDAGATATDAIDGSVTVTPSGTVDTSVAGTYTITYNATDVAGNAATAVTRTVVVAAASGDTTPPVISLTGSATVTVAWGGTYSDAGATATDNVDSSVTVNSSGTVNTAVPGTYTITYTAKDAANNSATPVTRTVTVSAPSSTPGADGLSGLLRYAFGANGPNDSVTRPTASVSGGNLLLTAIVRTNDSKLTVVGEAVTSLANYTNAPSITPVTGSASGVSQAGVPAGTERQAFTVPQGADTRKFLRLKATLAP